MNLRAAWKTTSCLAFAGLAGCYGFEKDLGEDPVVVDATSSASSTTGLSASTFPPPGTTLSEDLGGMSEETGGVEDSGSPLPGTQTTAVTGGEDDESAGEDVSTSAMPDDTSPDMPTRCGDFGASVFLEDRYNAAVTLDLALSPSVVRPRSELTLDWSQLQSTLLGDPIDSRDVASALFFLFPVPQEEFADWFMSEPVGQEDVFAMWVHEPEAGQTSASLYDFGPLGVPAPPEEILPVLDPELYPSSAYTHAFFVQTETSSIRPRALAVLDLDEASDDTTVSLTSASSVLTSDADLTSRRALRMPLRLSEYSVDWSNVTSSTRGTPFDPATITGLTLARFDDVTASELESSFLAWDERATRLFHAEVTSGTSLSVSALVDREGEPFTGIEDSGLWAIALECADCWIDVPHYFALIDPCIP